MPVFKIRHRDHHNLPMRGEDIIAFELDANNCITRVVVGEAKCVVRFRSATVREAHDRLQSAFRPRPMTLSMLAEIMYGRDRPDFGAEIDRVSLALAKGDFPRENWIFLINQDQPDDAFSTLADDADLVPELHCVGVSLPELTALVNALFDNPRISGDPEDAT